MKSKINKKLRTIIFISLFIIISLGVYIMTTSNNNPKVRILTSEGEIVLELYPKEAPITVENFLNYIEEGFYENTVFHRIITGFMIQGGGFTSDGNQKRTKEPIVLESNNGLKNERGTIAMARTMIPNSATSQFFINTADNDFLNYGVRDEGYAVFGKVVEGMDIIEKIEEVETGTKYGSPDWPKKDILIDSIEVL